MGAMDSSTGISGSWRDAALCSVWVRQELLDMALERATGRGRDVLAWSEAVLDRPDVADDDELAAVDLALAREIGRYETAFMGD